MLLSLYYALDALMGHLPMRRSRAQWGLAIADRSFFDYYYQLGHARVPMWWLRMLERVVPRPDLLVTIRRDAAEIHAGKPELSVEEIEREQACVERLMDARPHVLTLDGSLGVDACVEQVATTLLRGFGGE